MFGWLKRKKKYVPNPEMYPLDTCQHFVQYVRSAPHVSDSVLAHDILSRSITTANYFSIIDLVRCTRG